jgi:hypothetical protein
MLTERGGADTARHAPHQARIHVLLRKTKIFVGYPIGTGL